jgi:hypothetical protein
MEKKPPYCDRCGGPCVETEPDIPQKPTVILDPFACMVPTSIEVAWEIFRVEQGVTDNVKDADAIAFARKCCRQLQADFKSQMEGK